MKCSGIYCDMGCDGEEKEYSVGVEVEDSVGVGVEDSVGVGEEVY